jgi:hypothetical protein
MLFYSGRHTNEQSVFNYPESIKTPDSPQKDRSKTLTFGGSLAFENLLKMSGGERKKASGTALRDCDVVLRGSMTGLCAKGMT